jgi:hypothetical protein
MSTGLCLVTRGMICVPRTAEVLPLVSCDEPSMQVALEVRPRMRLVSAPPVPGLTPPVITGSEMRPKMKDADSPAVDQDPKPSSRVVVELRPVIKDVTED